MDLRREVAQRIDPQTYRQVPALREATARLSETIDHLKESFAVMQQIAREDRDWTLISTSLYQQFFDGQFLRELIKNARYYFVKNPIIRRAVTLHSYYVYGRNVEIRIDGDTAEAKRANVQLQKFLDANPLMQILGLTEIEQSKMTDGNVFLALISDPNLGAVKIRRIDPLEIAEIVSNPDDAEECWYFRRVWDEVRFDPATGATMPKPMEAWYPALAYQPAVKPAAMGGRPVNWDTPVLHLKTTGPVRSQMGIPPIYAAMDPASAYRRFIAHWSIVADVFARIGLTIETKGGQVQADSIKAQLGTTLGLDSQETNPTPQTGSAIVHGPGQKIAAMKTAGMQTSPDEAQALLRFAIMTMDFPETFYGNADIGNHATSKTLDRPTELAILHAQEVAKDMIRRICNFALAQASERPGGELRSATRQEFRVLVSFPPVLEHDIPALLGALVDFATLKGQELAGTIDPRTLMAFGLHLLGFEKVDELLEKIFPAGYDPSDWSPSTPEARAAAAADLAARAQTAGIQNAARGPLPTLVEALTRAIESRPVNGHA